jgi:hypothetical protein
VVWGQASTSNLGQVKVMLKRPGNKRWLDTPSQVTALTSAHATVDQKREAYKVYADTPVNVNARINFKYSLPPVTATAVSATQMPANYTNAPMRMNYPSQLLQMQQQPQMQAFYPGLAQ